jgi:hypothetical protein
MLKNFLDALAINGCKLKRVILTTGAKQYGLHLGPVKCPMEESDPWIEGPRRPPDFYDMQQRILHADAKKNSYDWVVTYPNNVIRIATGNFKNFATSLALYVVVNKELSEELEFPGSEAFYNCLDCFTDAKLHAVQYPAALNQNVRTKHSISLMETLKHGPICGLNWQNGLVARCLRSSLSVRPQTQAR